MRPHVTLIVLALAASSLLGGASAGQSPDASAVARAHASLADGSACLACHGGLAERPVVHAVVAAESCGDCHAAPSGGKGRVGLRHGATKDNTAPLCAVCHDEVGKRAALPGGHPPAASGDCASCHDPHGSDNAALLTVPAPELCVGCHDGVGESLKQAAPHAPAAGGCVSCHDVHGSARPAQLKDAVNTLCLGCHAGSGSATREAAGPGGQGAAAPAGRGITLEPSGRAGHPRAGHPVSGSVNPADKKKGPLTCASCHEPHGAVTEALLRFGARGTMELCLKCHP